MAMRGEPDVQHAGTPVDVVVFDLDDTLVDHRGSAGRALATWLPILDVPCVASVVAAWFEVEERHFARWRGGEITFAEQRRARLRELLPPELTAGSAESLDQLFADYLVHYERAWYPFPDALRCLRAVRGTGRPVAVLTNGPAAQQNRKVLATGLAAEVDAVFTSEGVGAAKPHRAAFDAVADALAVQAARAPYVGDSLVVDHRGAVGAG